MKNWPVDKIKSLRTVLMLIFILALLGPWSFDRIHVPAQYMCDFPNVRLYGDFCGLPFSGFHIAAWTAGGFFDIVFRQTSTLGGLWARRSELIAAIVVLFILGLAGLPLISTLLINLLKRWSMQVFHLVALSLASLASLFALIFQFGTVRLAAWGISLTFITSCLALMVEIFQLRNSPYPKPRHYTSTQ